MKKLDKRWKIILYAFSGIGINMMNLMVGSYLCDALMVEGYIDAGKDISSWTYLGITLVSAVIWSIMITIAKILDGVIDIPLAHFTDSLRTKWGRRKPAILIGLIPLIASYLLFLVPLQKGESLLNTFWFGFILCMFYTSYTLVMVTYYATFSEITKDDNDRMKLSSYKSVFDIIYFVLGYALIPMMIGFKLNIRLIALICLPLALSMLIPFFMIKEKSNLRKDLSEEELKELENEKAIEDVAKVSLKDSIVGVFKNKAFIIWMLIYVFLQFGLQMFLTGQSVYYVGVLGFSGFTITLLMASAFAPAPFMLILYNKIVQKFGFKVAYMYSALTFVLAMILFTLAILLPEGTPRIVISIAAGIVASCGIGSFFSVGYSIPSELANLEEKNTGKSHSAMFFAIQGLFSGAAAAIATGLVWVNLKNNNLAWTMGIFVAGSILISFVLAFFLPKELNHVGQLKKTEIGAEAKPAEEEIEDENN